MSHELHEAAVAIGQSIEINDKEPAKSVIADAQMKSYRQSVKAMKEDMALMVDLVLIAVRLEKGGLAAAAAQLVELAKIGLEPAALASVVMQAATGDKRPVVPGNSSQNALNASVKQAQTTGVGLRRR